METRYVKRSQGDDKLCGIVVVAGESTKQNHNVLETLLILDQLRGIDSTGIAAIPRGDFDVNIAKEVGNAFDLMGTKGYFNAMNCLIYLSNL